MRTPKTISVSLPAGQLREMARVAKKENRTLSELLREAFRHYVEAQASPSNLADALDLVREDAHEKGLHRLTQKEINAEIRAYRREQQASRKLKRPA